MLPSGVLHLVLPLVAVDPNAATRPSPLSFVAFCLLALALGLLLLSMTRHLRRAERNLDPQDEQVPPDPLAPR